MTPLARMLRALVESYGLGAVDREIAEMRAENDTGARPRRRRGSVSRAEAARRAAAMVPADELAAARARRR